MPDIDIGLLSPTAAQANDAMVVRRGVDPTETVALVDLADFATAAQGALADSAVQPGDDLTTSHIQANGSEGVVIRNSGGTNVVVMGPANGTGVTFAGGVNTGALGVTGNITVSGTVDGRDIASDGTKLDGVAPGATANATDAFLLARANHTGTQAAGTITGLASIATSGSASDLSAGTLPAARLPAFGSGDVSFASAGGAGTIAANAVTNAKLADMATATIKGRATAGTGDPEDLTATQATALLDTFTSGAKGLAPASGGGTTNFLRADGTWAVPSSGGSTTITAAPAADQADWNPSGFGASVGMILMQPTTNSFITGLAAGAANQVVILVNDSDFLICLERESGASTAANRFRERATGSIWILPGLSVTMRYSATLSRWALIDQSRDVFAPGPRTMLTMPNTTASVSNDGIHSVTTTGTITTQGAVGTPTTDMGEYATWQARNATASGTASVRSLVAAYMRGATAGRQGFFHTARVRFPELGATGAVRAGLTNSTMAQTPVNTSLALHCLLLGAQTSDTSLSIYTGNGSVGTPVPLGSNFPVPSSTAEYEYAFLALPDTSEVQYMVRRLDSRFVAQGTLTASLPGNTTGMGHRVEATVGGTAAGNAVLAAYLLTVGL